jgi:cbb3-type cytochrome oxidase subunit 3
MLLLLIIVFFFSASVKQSQSVGRKLPEKQKEMNDDIVNFILDFCKPSQKSGVRGMFFFFLVYVYFLLKRSTRKETY